jgi:hypothetical protein
MNTSDLIMKIETLRELLISVGMTHGFTSPETIQLSEMLDKLLNQLMS